MSNMVEQTARAMAKVDDDEFDYAGYESLARAAIEVIRDIFAAANNSSYDLAADALNKELNKVDA